MVDHGPTPRLSVLIPQYGEVELTVRAVEAVRRSDYAGQVEILVFDNASPGGVGPVASRDDVRVLPHDANIGFGPAVNAMAHEARGEVLLILNNDTIVDPRAIRLMVQRLHLGDEPGVVVPQYRDFDGRTLEMGGFVGRGGTAAQFLHRITPPPAVFEHGSFQTHYGSAAALMVSRPLFLSNGGFDSAYDPAYYEDTDLCLSLARNGRPTVVEPRAVVFHYEGATAGRDLSAGAKAHQTINRAKFARRWEPWLRTLPPARAASALQHLTQPDEGQVRILWMTPTFPRPDRDGGGRRIVAMIEALRGSSETLTLWAQHAEDHERYGRMLEDLGVLWFGGTGPSRWPEHERRLTRFDDLPFLLSSVPWDVVVISFARLATNRIPAVREHAPGACLLIDDGDLHFLRNERAHALGVELPSELDKDVELDVYAMSDGVITASELEERSLHVELPGIATHTFTVAAPEPDVSDSDPEPDRVLFLGNFGHPPNVDAVEWWLREIGPRVSDLVGRDIRLRLIGTGTEAYVSGLSEDEESQLDIGGWVPDLATEFHRARVFVAPLRYGAGTKGKVLDALAFGVPTVTTTIGAEGNSDNVTGSLLIADDAEGIAAAVAQLLEDDKVWRSQRDRVVSAAEQAHEEQRRKARELPRWFRDRMVAHRRRTPAPQEALRARDVPGDQAPDPPAAAPAEPSRIGRGRPAPSPTPSRVPPSTVAPDPIIIYGAPRSGTTYLRTALCQDPNINITHETRLFVWAYRSLVEVPKDEKALKSLGPRFLTHVRSEYPDLIRGFYRDLDPQAYHWGDKNPFYASTPGVLELIDDLFPRTRYLHIIRDGRDVVTSLMRKRDPDGSPWADFDVAHELWLTSIEHGQRFGEQVRDRYYELRYEDLVADDPQQVTAVLEFLDVEPHEHVMEYCEAQQRERTPLSGPTRDLSDAAATTSDWSGFLSTAEQLQSLSLIGDELVRLGYASADDLRRSRADLEDEQGTADG